MPRKKITTEEAAVEVTAAEATATEAVVAEAPVADETAAAEAPVEAPVKKTRKRTSKKAAAEGEATEEAAVKKTTRKRTSKKAAAEGEATEEAAVKKTTRKRTSKKAAAEGEATEEAAVKKTTRKRTSKKAAAEEAAPAAEAPVVEETASAVEAPVAEEVLAAAEEVLAVADEAAPYSDESPRRSICFIGSECHPFVKTGGLGDVMYALPRALNQMNCDVRVILPRYECIPEKFQDKMVYRGSFYMDLGETGRDWYVGIMEYVWDGVVYDFIDNQELFSGPKPYTDLHADIPKYCYFSKAALAALNYMDWIPDVIHCHDWQAGLVPIFQKELFQNTPVGRSRTVITIHNLRFQGICGIKMMKHWTGLPDYAFEMNALKQNWEDANMFKGGLAYADKITTVSATYAKEIQTEEYGEHLEAHLRYHAGKLHGIVNGIDVDMWNPATDAALTVNYDIDNAVEQKKASKLALQEELGLAKEEEKFVIGLISRLTDQKGLDLVNAIIPEVMDEHTQIVVLGTGEAEYENSFRYYESVYPGSFSACIQYDEARAHRIYAGADALLVPSRFEPCGLTQLNAMHYGTVPIVRETGGLKDTVLPYDETVNSGNGFTFDRYDAGLLLDAINRAKSFYFTSRQGWDEMVCRDMAKDVSWENSARQYKNLYLELTQW